MTMKDGLQTGWMKNIGYKVPLAIFAVLLPLVVWECSNPSFLSYSSLSALQIQTYLSGGPASEYAPSGNVTSSDSTHVQPDSPVVPAVHTDSPDAEKASAEPREPKMRPVETVSPDPQLQNESPVEEDTQLVTEEVAVSQDEPQHLEEEKFIIPLLSYQVGTGNQLMEYRAAATIARTLNRTLCLIPFWGGPDRHFGYLGNRHSGLYVEDRYDTEVLSKYVKIVSMDECLQKCERRMDVFWRLRPGRPPHWGSWFTDRPKFSIDFTRDYNHWSSTADIAATLVPQNEPRCVGLTGIFPGLQWRGVTFATSTYLQHSKKIMKATDIFQARALGTTDNDFLAVHWRFEESNCRGHPLGLCLSRCEDGAVIANGRPSETWNNMTQEGKAKFGKPGFTAVLVSQSDVSNAIYDRATQHGMRNVYLSSDGWLRGPESSGVLAWVVGDLRNKGMNVAGLWMIGALANFADGFRVHPKNMADLFGLDPKEEVSNHMIAVVEQELCVRSKVFLGTGQSSWSRTIADTRRGRRCKAELNDLITGFNLGTPPDVTEQAIIDRILTIQYTAGPTCRGSNESVAPIMHRWQDEGVDGYLDYDSCEMQMLKGVGECRRIID